MVSNLKIKLKSEQLWCRAGVGYFYFTYGGKPMILNKLIK